MVLRRALPGADRSSGPRAAVAPNPLVALCHSSRWHSREQAAAKPLVVRCSLAARVEVP